MLATILIDNHAEEGLVPEWGLSVHIEQAGHSILLDTGSSGKCPRKMSLLGSTKKVVLMESPGSRSSTVVTSSMGSRWGMTFLMAS